MNLVTAFWAFLLVLPLPGIENKPVTQPRFDDFVSNTLNLNPIHVLTLYGYHTAKTDPENRCGLPFAKPFCILARFAGAVSMDTNSLIGPFTGHLAINRVVGISERFDGAPISRNSAVSVVALASPESDSVTAWVVRVGSNLGAPKIRPVPLPCMGMYAVDLLYSGRDPALGRVWHREVIGFNGGEPRVLFSTGGFALGPMGAFSVGPGFCWSVPGEMLISAWSFQGCEMTGTSIHLLASGRLDATVTDVTLGTSQQTKRKWTIDSPFTLSPFSAHNPMIILAWSVQALRSVRVAVPAVGWVLARTVLAGALYGVTGIRLDFRMLADVWMVVG